MEKRDKQTIWGIFMGAFALYLHTAGPWVVPYRDAGEMSALLKTLSVAHPPGYPVYTLIGKIWTLIPFGSVAYRTNLFSAFCAALALCVFYLVLRKYFSILSSLIATVCLGFSFPFWELASVSEMYALGAFWFCLILWICLTPEAKYAFPFVYALGLGVRMDLMLLLPVFVFWIYFQDSRPRPIWMAAAFALGLTVFLYLPIRSRGNPLIDWGNPETLGAVFASMSRKSYSGTLDLLSLSYRKGENFWPTIKLYAGHLMKYFGVLGILGGIFGVVSLTKTNKQLLWLIGPLFLLAGPFFFFLANMPPNPHSVAIIEASYLVPDILMAIFVGAGIHMLIQKFPNRTVVGAVCAVLLFVNASHGYARCNKRDNFAVRDYLATVLRSMPPDSVGVFHKDVQLFSLWYNQIVEKKRMDLSLVSTGLSGSLWYWDMKRRWGTASSPEISLKSTEGWPELKSLLRNRLLLLGCDVETGDLKLPLYGAGAVMGTGAPDEDELNQAMINLKEFFVLRSGFHYGESPDFFSSDLIEDEARAHHQLGLSMLSAHHPDLAEWLFIRARNLDPNFARASSDLGYIYFTEGKYPEAVEAFERGIQDGNLMIQQAEEYKALSDTLLGIKADLAQMYVSLGGTLERLGKKPEARISYEKSLEVSPNAQAHYNLAVTYWDEDWPRVIDHLQSTLRMNPQNVEAQKYLSIALMKLGKR